MIKLDKWLSLFPELKNDIPIYCPCGQAATTIKPYVSKNWVGVTSVGCECGLGETAITIPRTQKFSTYIKSLLQSSMPVDR